MGRNKELTEAQRGAILYCRKRGDKICTIAKTVNCGVTTVRDTLKRHAETGQTQSRKRFGRPPLLTDRQRLKRLVTTKAENRRLCKDGVRRLWMKNTSTRFMSHSQACASFNRFAKLHCTAKATHFAGQQSSATFLV
jgi:transposase